MHTLVALLVFAIGLGATLYYWKNLQQSVQSEVSNAFNKQSQGVSEAVTDRINEYENFLRGSAGLFSIHSGLTQGDWVKYHEPYNIKQNYPDIQSIGVSRYLPAAEVPAYLERRKNQGDTTFKIFPEGDRPVYAPVTFSAVYGEPDVNNRGFDTSTEVTRKKAMERAVETNKMTMSGRVDVHGDQNKNHSSFILYLPVYRRDQPTATASQRQAALLGFVFIAVDTEAFVNDILSSNQNPYIALQVFDAEAEHGERLTYQSGNFNAIAEQDGAQIESRSLEAKSHTWRVVFAGSPELISARERQLPEQALWRGLVTCIFFAGLVWYLVTDRERKYARQKREEVQTAKDDLLSLASHQLRTPATVVKQYVGMLLQGYAGKLSEQQLHMLTNAYDSNERQLEIINQLLYVARLDAGRITLHLKETDIAKLIRDIAREQEETIAARKQHLTFNLPKRSLHADVDPHYMRMVLENLLSNAVKYTPEAGAIHIELKRSGQTFVVTVTDDGVGIDPAVQPTIFEKFTRVENELSTDVNGSGVGLYLTKQIVELHKGTIEVQSETGNGSSFVVRVPLKDTEASTSV